MSAVAIDSKPETRFPKVFRVLREALAARAFPGCAFGALTQGQVVLRSSLGRFTYEDDAPAVVPGTIFDIASLTKVAATTAAAMLLHQRGQLSLEIPVGALLPGFVAGRGANDPARGVKLRHLLAHNSGLPGYVEFFQCTKDFAGVRAILAELSLQAEPGEMAEYSDPGFILLGKAIEVITGESLADWCSREIYLPLRMKSTLFRPPSSLKASIPPTEINAVTGRRIQGEVQDENARMMNGVAGHAGLFSNVDDLLRFAEEILASRKSSRRSSCYTSKTVGFFAQRQSPAGSSRALGWDTPSEASSSGHYFSSRSIGHLGFSGCSLWIDLDADLAVVLLTNRTWPDRQNLAIKQVRPAFHDAVREALSLL